MIWTYDGPKMSQGPFFENTMSISAPGVMVFRRYHISNSPINRIDPLGLRWEYSQRTGRLWYVNDATGRRTFVGEGFSGGGEGRNNPTEQDVKRVGPIPRGDWNIGPAYRGALGPITLNLSPQPGTETFNRDLFRIHGGTRSEGCIIMDQNTRQRVNRSQDRTLRVIW